MPQSITRRQLLDGGIKAGIGLALSGELTAFALTPAQVIPAWRWSSSS